MKKIKQFLFWAQSEIQRALSPVPEIKEDYVDKVVHLLRKDFTSEEQNEIIMSIGTKITQMRKEDMIKLKESYEKLSLDTVGLESRLVFG